jgi:hypothetical protein
MAAHPLTACVWFGVTSIANNPEVSLLLIWSLEILLLSLVLVVSCDYSITYTERFIVGLTRLVTGLVVLQVTVK